MIYNGFKSTNNIYNSDEEARTPPKKSKRNLLGMFNKISDSPGSKQESPSAKKFKEGDERDVSTRIHQNFKNVDNGYNSDEEKRTPPRYKVKRNSMGMLNKNNSPSSKEQSPNAKKFNAAGLLGISNQSSVEAKAHHEKKTVRNLFGVKNRGVNTENIQLTSNDDNTKNLVTKWKGCEYLTLKFLANGKFHMVWNAMEDDSIVVKTLKKDLNQGQQEKSITETRKAYENLTNREKEEGDIKVAKLLNDFKKDRFYIYEKITGPVPSFDQVKIIFEKMIKDSSFFIADFRPDNVRMVEDKIVIIDPSFDQDQEDLAINLIQLIKSWMTKDKVLDKKKLLEVVDEFDKLELNEGAKEIWMEVSERLRSDAS